MQKQCWHGSACRNQNYCKFYHPQLTGLVPKHCKFGIRCWDKLNCKYYHPHPEAKKQQKIKQSYRQKANTKDFEQGKSEHQQNKCVAKVLDQQPVNYKQQNSQCLQKIYINCAQQNGQTPNLNFSQGSRNALNEIYRGQQKYLQNQLQRFFNIRYMKSKQFDNIYNYLEQHINLDDLPKLFTVLERLQSEQFSYTPHFSYFTLIKVIVNNEYDFEKTCIKLQKKLKIQQKKNKKQQQLFKQFPNPIPFTIIKDDQLLQAHQKYTQHNIIFIVDGDNVLPTHKIFRTYFSSKNNMKKAEGQIRFRWLVSEMGNCMLFFDHERVSQQMYEQIEQKIMYKQDIINCHSQNISFANKYQQGYNFQIHANSQNQQSDQFQNLSDNNSQLQQTDQTSNSVQKMEADDLILKWISNFIHKSLNSKKQQNKNKNETFYIKQDQIKLILVTADRILIQKCLKLTPMLITSGNFFIKFCKQRIRRKYYGNKIKKSVIKRIFIQA